MVDFNHAGFLVVRKNKLDIYEWDEDSESLVETALVQKEVLTSTAVFGVNAEDLQC